MLHCPWIVVGLPQKPAEIVCLLPLNLNLPPYTTFVFWHPRLSLLVIHAPIRLSLSGTYRKHLRPFWCVCQLQLCPLSLPVRCQLSNLILLSYVISWHLLARPSHLDIYPRTLMTVVARVVPSPCCQCPR